MPGLWIQFLHWSPMISLILLVNGICISLMTLRAIMEATTAPCHQRRRVHTERRLFQSFQTDPYSIHLPYVPAQRPSVRQFQCIPCLLQFLHTGIVLKIDCLEAVCGTHLQCCLKSISRSCTKWCIRFRCSFFTIDGYQVSNLFGQVLLCILLPSILHPYLGIPLKHSNYTTKLKTALYICIFSSIRQ